MVSPVVIVLYNFITGSLCLIYGVELLSKGLEKSNTGMLKKILSTCTGGLSKAFFSGTIVTALVQSSTAVTLITIGLVNSGLIPLSNATGIIYGANIGTTVTAQLMSIKITTIGWPALVIGCLILFISRKSNIRNLGKAFIGFGFMFIGLDILNSGVPYIKESKFIYNLFRAYGKNPIACLLVGMIVTALVHSSSATVGLTIVLFNAGLIDFNAAIGLMLGDNVGTCITSLTASFKSGIVARRTAWAHTLYNVIGVLVVLLLFKPFATLVKTITFSLGQDKTRLVANAHTIFNILSAIAFLPINEYYVKFINLVIIDNITHRKIRP